MFRTYRRRISAATKISYLLTSGVHITNCVYVLGHDNYGLMIRKMMSQVKMKPKVIFVLGAPGSGKGTQCENIVKDYGYAHYSAGELLREEQLKPDSKYGNLINTYLKDGKIVPVEISCSLLENAMFSSNHSKFLIDGFPRNQDNVDGWARCVADKVDLEFVLYLHCPLDVCMQRCLQRGRAGSGRSDDNEESLRKRIETHLSQTSPIIKYYETLKLLRQVDASKSKEEVYEEVNNIFKSLKESNNSREGNELE